MNVYLNNCNDGDKVFGWVGDDDCGGWFFLQPEDMRDVTKEDVEAAIDSMEEDEIDPPDDDLDRAEAEEAIRRRLEKYVY